MTTEHKLNTTGFLQVTAEPQLDLSKFMVEFVPHIKGVESLLDYGVAKVFSEGLASGFTEASNVVTKWDKAPTNGFYFSSVGIAPYGSLNTWGKFKEKEYTHRDAAVAPRGEAWQLKQYKWNLFDTLWVGKEREISFYMRTNAGTGTRTFLVVPSDNPNSLLRIKAIDLKAMLALFETCFKSPKDSSKLRMQVINYIGAIWDILSSTNTINVKVLSS